jgi:hypothetical protein
MQHFIKKSIGLLGAIALLFSISTIDLSAQRAPEKKPAKAQKPAAKPSTVQKPAAKPANPKSTTAKPSSNTKSATGKTGEIGNNKSNKNISGNTVNVDKSRGDVNINVDNSKDIKVKNTRNTSVRNNSYRAPYSRPPYRYGGFHYRCYNPYFYHPYRPFYWGPRWHPWGFFIATLAATAIIVSFADADVPPVNTYNDYFAIQAAMVQEGKEKMRSGPSMYEYDAGGGYADLVNADEEYYYDEGVFYIAGSGGYTVVAAPVGGVVKTIPSGYETVALDDAGKVNNYYWGGTFYEKVSNGYKVVAPTAGAVVENMPDGGEEVKLGDVTYVKLGETYYQPTQVGGKNKYEVVSVEEDK